MTTGRRWLKLRRFPRPVRQLRFAHLLRAGSNLSRGPKSRAQRGIETLRLSHSVGTLATGRRWLKFNLVGAIGIVVQLTVLGTLNGVLRLDYLLATAMAVEAAVLHNFLWHERFTWADRSSVTRRQALGRLLRFNLTTGAVSILGNLLLMRLLVGQAHLPPLAANLVSIAACSLANFLASEYLVFRARPVEDAP
jgi:putative flippase GtrA